MSEEIPTRPRNYRSRIAAIGFPVVLWFIAYLFFRGDTGFWADDYSQNFLGSDGSPPAVSFFAKWPFWSWGLDRGFFIRPLFFLTLPAWTTLIWNHPQVGHFVQALFHAGLVMLLWRLMRKLGVHRRAAAAAALLFMVYPGHYEVVLWVGAFPTLWSVAIVLGVMFMTIGFARAERGWWRLPLIGAASFAACCFNEQPAAGVAVLPVAYLAAVPAGKSLWTRRNVLRAVAVGLVGGAAVALYAFLLIGSTPPGSRGSEQSIVTAAALPMRMVGFSRNVVSQTALVGFARGAWSIGLRAVGEGGVWSWLLAGALCVTSVFWIVTPRRWEKRGESPHARRGLLVVLGLGVFVTGWIPILVITNYPPDSRMRYWPCMGLALAAAAACSGMRAAANHPPMSLTREPRKLVAARAAMAVVLIMCAIPIIGTQAAYQARWRRDQSEGDQLRALVPNPAPHTLFQPMTVGHAFPATGSKEIDTRFTALWWFPWAPRKFMQRKFGRDDISATYWQALGNPVLGADERGILYSIRLGPVYSVREGEGSRVPWDRWVPFVVDESGWVRVVRTVVIPASQEGEDVTIQVPQCDVADGVVYRLPRR